MDDLDCSHKAELRAVLKKRLEQNVFSRHDHSAEIWRRLETLDVFRRAAAQQTLMVYLDFQHEVETTCFLSEYQNLIVPYCPDDDIVPVAVQGLSELEVGHFGILEPSEEIRRSPQRQVLPKDISVVLVPGLGFDPLCNRLGRGKGYYDRFLATLPTSVVSIGLAFECQIVAKIPVSPGDKPVTIIVTEERCID